MQYSNYKNYQLFGTDTDIHAQDLYDKSLYKKTYLVPPAGKNSYWKDINQIVQNHKIDFALIQPELEVLEWSKRARSEDLPCKTLIPEYKLAKVLYDKALMSEYLFNSKLIPKTFVLNSDFSNMKDIENEIGYPFWIRSASGSMGLGSLKIKDSKALKNWVFINPDVEKFIISEYLPGRNLVCKMLYYNGSLIRAACGERVNYIMSKIVPSGITGNTSFGRLINDENIFNCAKKTMDILFKKTNSKKHGFYSVDLKEDAQGKPYITEVNIRHIAFSLCFSMAGMNFPEDSIRLLNEDSNYDEKFNLFEFDKDLIFLRNVDTLPIVMKESELL